jgi:3-hydroxybutyryl-CoA dehydrogenase
VTGLPRDVRIGVLGAGAMGSGIAQVAAAAGYQVVVTDPIAEAVARGAGNLRRNMQRDVEKGRLTTEEADGLEARVTWSDAALGYYAPFTGCALVIEAIVEELDAKQAAFHGLEGVVGDDALLATNTSSLSVTAIAAACRRPERVVGIHFFNPAPVLPLVEIVPGLGTAAAAAEQARATVASWGKTVVMAADTPGFIVNRIARPFYGEALRIYEERVADRATIDWAMKEKGGFRMGPFALMDLIGNDVNYAVTRSIFESLHYDPRYKPSVTQQRLVEAGRFGQKSGRGHYEYQPGAPAPEPVRDDTLAGRIVPRILAMLINEAADALFWGIASRDDIDLAMTKGVAYPKGLLRWADELGIATVVERLDALQAEYGEDRYRPSPLLRRMAAQNERFYP